MKVFQLLPTLVYGDGVGNETLVIDKILKSLGYETKIYAENIDKRISSKTADVIARMPELYQADVVIYHLSTGTVLNETVGKLKCKIVIIYHNITPPHFFNEYSISATERSKQGLKGVEELRENAHYCIADSYYNKQQLIQMGYRCRIDVVPVIVPFKDYEKKPSKSIINKYNDNYVNIVFVGRIVPNKKQEDIIKSFYFYKNYINDKSRLFLIGSYSGMERYKIHLDKYIQSLGLDDVHFTGHIKFNQILSYYKLADIFLCMSEHEGFCIPLLEAMYFQIPIIAYASTGVKDTLGDCGFQIREKNCKMTAEMIDYIIKKEEFRKQLIERQNLRLMNFSYENTHQKFVECLTNFLEEGIER